MIIVDFGTKTLLVSKGTPLNQVYIELQLGWGKAIREHYDVMEISKFPMTFEADHTTGTIKYRTINQWKIEEK